MRPGHFEPRLLSIILIALAVLLAHPDEAHARQQKHTTSHPSRPSSKVKKVKTAKTDKTRHPPSTKRQIQSSSSKTVEPTTPLVHAAPKIPVRSDLDGDDRINELRNWLHQRNAERDNKIEPDRYESDFLSAEPAPAQKHGLRRKPLDLDYIPPVDDGFENNGSVLHIGRSPDGRVYHRYILRDSGTEMIRPNIPDNEIMASDEPHIKPVHHTTSRKGKRTKNKAGKR